MEMIGGPVLGEGSNNAFEREDWICIGIRKWRMERVRGAISWMKHDARIPVRAMLAHSGQEYSDKYRRYRKGKRT